MRLATDFPTPGNDRPRGRGLVTPACTPDRFEIRRAGGGKLRFTGQVVARLETLPAEGVPGYAAALYDARRGDAVVELRIKRKPCSAESVMGWRACSRAAALDILRSRDATDDVSVDFDPDDPGFAPAELVARAFDLRARIARARLALLHLADALAEAAGPAR